MEVLGQSGTTNFAKSGIFRARQLVTDGRDYGGSRPVRRGLFCQVSRSLGSWPLVKAGSEDTGLGWTSWPLVRVSCWTSVKSLQGRPGMVENPIFPIPRRHLVAIAGRFILLGRADHSD
ncbi:hypothetical protein KQX54_013069 [Cotesia glomerata]|uniref:Uncharacterized protein n=1 Tax=Cotesia glomerata TaxID=32391 RepID=A0AAV7I355_COTGL|nr:hypothetical protein KQX54_013069 [Cotesia glomerata]